MIVGKADVPEAQVFQLRSRRLLVDGSLRYSHILIDLDHTLLDSDASEAAAFRDTLLSVGVIDPARHLASFQVINRALWSAVERQEATPSMVRVARFERLAPELGVDVDPVIMADRYVEGLAAFGELYPHARDVLDELSKRATLALVTNGIGAVQRSRIDRLNLGRYFGAVVVSGEVGAAKPSSDIFDLAFEALGQPEKTSTLMVGDSLSSDIRGGNDYGIATCWYNPSGKRSGVDVAITHEIDDLRRLLPLVGR